MLSPKRSFMARGQKCNRLRRPEKSTNISWSIAVQLVYRIGKSWQNFSLLLSSSGLNLLYSARAQYGPQEMERK